MKLLFETDELRLATRVFSFKDKNKLKTFLFATQAWATSAYICCFYSDGRPHRNMKCFTVRDECESCKIAVHMHIEDMSGDRRVHVKRLIWVTCSYKGSKWQVWIVKSFHGPVTHSAGHGLVCASCSQAVCVVPAVWAGWRTRSSSQARTAASPPSVARELAALAAAPAGRTRTH